MEETKGARAKAHPRRTFETPQRPPELPHRHNLVLFVVTQDVADATPRASSASMSRFRHSQMVGLQLPSMAVFHSTDGVTAP
jgi:hypothetical protein